MKMRRGIILFSLASFDLLLRFFTVIELFSRIALNNIESIYYENTDINEKWIKLRVYIEWVSKEEIYVATNILRAINIVLNINE